MDRLAKLFPNGELRAYPQDARVWFFVTYGTFNAVSRDLRGPTVTTSVDIVVEGVPSGSIKLSNNRYDLSTLGTAVAIPRGQVPEIDAARAPADASP